MTSRLKIYAAVAVAASLLLQGCGPDAPVEIPDEVTAPANVRLVSSDKTSLVFEWDEVKGADFYVARLETSDGVLVNGGQTSTKETSIMYQGLTEETSYCFKVRAKVGGSDSPYSDPITADTAGDDTPGIKPKPQPNEFYAQFQIPSHEDAHADALAFPGAEGGGMYTTGGRGGKVIHVTTLADSGAGSLRAAVNESATRTIVFDVAGIIELKSALSIKNGNLTIAGQTAPGDGICIKNYEMKFENAENIIIRYIRFRMGDEAKREADALWGRYNRNIIIDHCSMSWSTDECSSFYANEYFTMQWCILTESLRNSVHGKGQHGYGGIWGGKNASFHHNLLSNHDSRNPRIDHPQIYGNYVETHRGNVDYRCNAVYNWGSNHTYGGEDGWFNIVNNYYKPGPASSDRKYFVDAYGSYVKDGTTYADSYPQMYLNGNVNTKYPELGAANDASTIYWHNGSGYGNYNTLLTSALEIDGPQQKNVYTTTHSAEASFNAVCQYAGASLVRDIVDERACTDATNGTATYMNGGNGSKNGIIDTQSAVGGWPAYNATSEEIAAVKDTDSDGMPDWFENQFGLDDSSASDSAKKTLDQYGRYTNLEMYLHYLVREITASQNNNGEYIKLN
ncbi:MAG: pectate lyase [Bacteroidales bacterium]|nr:pectate lyase [Bacteroidales bacterium]